MKIILFTENNCAGGMDTFCHILVKNWPDKNDTFILISNHDHPGLQNLKQYFDGKVEIIPHTIPINWSLMNKYNLGASNNLFLRVLRKLLRISLFPVQFFLIRQLFKKIKGDYLMVVNGAYPGGETCRVANIAWKFTYDKRSLHTFHNYTAKYPMIMAPYESLIDKMLINSCNYFISCSRSCADSLRVRPRFLDAKNIKSIYFGLPKPIRPKGMINLRETLNISDNNKILLMLGNYEPRKGHKFMFDALKIVYKTMKNIDIIVCGGSNDSYKDEIKKYVKTLPFSNNIHCLDFIHNGSDLIYQADVLLIASQEYESFGLTALESMLRGVPVVSTNVGGLTEVLGQNGQCGFYCGKNDTNRYAENVLTLLGSEKIRQEVSNQAKRRAVESFSCDKMSKTYHDLLKE